MTLKNTCSSLLMSPSTSTGGTEERRNSMARAAAVGVIDSTTPRINSRMSTFSSSNEVRPAEIREKSSKSSMSRACLVALSEIDWSARTDFTSASDPRWSIVVHPRIEFSGVRSSCETIDTNSSLRRLACSASARACCVDS